MEELETITQKLNLIIDQLDKSAKKAYEDGRALYHFGEWSELINCSVKLRAINDEMQFIKSIHGDLIRRIKPNKF